MPILVGDVKLVASQVMDDVAEGGGAPTSTVIVDGASNSLFNDISEMDRAGGRVNLRKVDIPPMRGHRSDACEASVPGHGRPVKAVARRWLGESSRMGRFCPWRLLALSPSCASIRR